MTSVLIFPPPTRNNRIFPAARSSALPRPPPTSAGQAHGAYPTTELAYHNARTGVARTQQSVETTRLRGAPRRRRVEFTLIAPWSGKSTAHSNQDPTVPLPRASSTHHSLRLQNSRSPGDRTPGVSARPSFSPKLGVTASSFRADAPLRRGCFTPVHSQMSLAAAAPLVQPAASLRRPVGAAAVTREARSTCRIDNLTGVVKSPPLQSSFQAPCSC